MASGLPSNLPTSLKRQLIFREREEDIVFLEWEMGQVPSHRRWASLQLLQALPTLVLFLPVTGFFRTTMDIHPAKSSLTQALLMSEGRKGTGCLDNSHSSLFRASDVF
jgi:hypothetical protein